MLWSEGSDLQYIGGRWALLLLWGGLSDSPDSAILRVTGDEPVELD